LSASVLYIPLRSPNADDADSAALLAAMGATVETVQGAWPRVLFGPGLPPFSSTQAREALQRGDTELAKTILPDKVQKMSLFPSPLLTLFHAIA
jgi:hypothetical protein